MRKLRALWMRIGGLFRFRGADGEFSAELESHVAMHVEDGMRAGLSEEEARRQAMIRLGGLEQTKIAYRERQGLPWFETLWQDAVPFDLAALFEEPEATFPPWLIFLRVLWQLYGEELEQEREEEGDIPLRPSSCTASGVPAASCRIMAA